jgi:hypothetical protein
VAPKESKMILINSSIAIDSISRIQEMTLSVVSQDLNDEIAELITNETLSIKAIKR